MGPPPPAWKCSWTKHPTPTWECSAITRNCSPGKPLGSFCLSQHRKVQPSYADGIAPTTGCTNAHWLEGRLIAQQVHLFFALKWSIIYSDFSEMACVKKEPRAGAPPIRGKSQQWNRAGSHVRSSKALGLWVSQPGGEGMQQDWDSVGICCSGFCWTSDADTCQST